MMHFSNSHIRRFNVFVFLLYFEFIRTSTGLETGANVNKSVVLSCPVNPPNDAVSIVTVSVRWSKGQLRAFIGQKLLRDGGDKYIDSSKYEIVNTTSLLITRVLYSDDDVYRCTLSYYTNNRSDERRQSSGDVKLSICESFDLKLVVRLTDKVNNTGNLTYDVPAFSSISSLCTAYGGRPQTTIIWYKDGEKLSSIHQNITHTPIGDRFNSVNALTFKSLQPQYSGLYSCRARNPAMNTYKEKHFSLHVLLPKDSDELLGDGNTVLRHGKLSPLGVIILSVMVVVLLSIVGAAVLFLRYRKQRTVQGDTRYTIV
ncbi:hemicentin-1-like [Saccoglossus kowalevskii]